MKLQNCLLFCLAVMLPGFGCHAPENPDWQHLDKEKDGVFGISTNRAYNELLKGKKPAAVIVAVIDAGFDTTHEDLRQVLWTNPKEIPGNGIDDDSNGYIDDVHGWNFAGDADSTYHYDNDDLTRLVRQEQQGPPSAAYPAHLADLEKERREAKEKLDFAQKMKRTLDAMVKQLGTKNPTLKDFENFAPKNDLENQVRSRTIASLKHMSYDEFYSERVIEEIASQADALNYGYNVNYEPHRPIRVVAGDTVLWPGNGDLAGKKPLHGTHIAGIIAADRTNDSGIQGIADNVRIMAIRLGYGAIRDEDIARAIRYAVDNGARVINMSFGKEKYSLDKARVDAALNYAAARDVLLVQAAGNSSKDLDKTEPIYPTSFRADGTRLTNWITVGASNQTDDETLRASFSNYGKTKVDVFAPGIAIRSTVPGGAYKRLNGTSMAAPVVTGLAALIRSYYPALTARQVREIILKSVVKSPWLADRCVTGGVVNAYNAIKLAEGFKGNASK